MEKSSRSKWLLFSFSREMTEFILQKAFHFRITSIDVGCLLFVSINTNHFILSLTFHSKITIIMIKRSAIAFSKGGI